MWKLLAVSSIDMSNSCIHVIHQMVGSPLAAYEIATPLKGKSYHLASLSTLWMPKLFTKLWLGMFESNDSQKVWKPSSYYSKGFITVFDYSYNLCKTRIIKIFIKFINENIKNTCTYRPPTSWVYGISLTISHLHYSQLVWI